jgi:hypothetical protein
MWVMWQWEISKRQTCNNYQTEPWPGSDNGSEMCRGNYILFYLPYEALQNTSNDITRIYPSVEAYKSILKILQQTPILRLACCHFPWWLSFVTSSFFRNLMKLGVELVTDVPGHVLVPSSKIWLDPFRHGRYVLKFRWPSNNLRRTISQPTYNLRCTSQKERTSQIHRDGKSVISYCVLLYSFRTRKQNVTP